MRERKLKKSIEKTGNKETNTEDRGMKEEAISRKRGSQKNHTRGREKPEKDEDRRNEGELPRVYWFRRLNYSDLNFSYFVNKVLKNFSSIFINTISGVVKEIYKQIKSLSFFTTISLI